MPLASKLAPLDCNACTAPASIKIWPLLLGPANNHFFRPSLGAVSFKKRVPGSCSLMHFKITFSSAPLAIITSTPALLAISAACSLVAIPPVPRFVPLPPASWRNSSLIWVTSSIKVALMSVRGSLVNNPC